MSAPSSSPQGTVSGTKGVLRRFYRARHAVSAVEFALILPILILLALGSVEAARLIIFSRRLNLVATTIVQMITQNTTGTVNYVDLHFAADSTMVIFPEILQDSAQKQVAWANDISVSMASITFTPTSPTCTSGCTYQANVVWHSGPAPRPCNVALTSVPDSSSPSPTTLPADLFEPGSVIVVDIAYTYTPLFNLHLFGPIPMTRSVYVAPRYVPLIKYAAIAGDDGTGTECPGY